MRNEPDEVDEIVVRATQTAISHGIWHYEPNGLTAAQMNMGFGIAMQMIEGETFVDQMVDANIARPDLIALSHKVRGERDEARENAPRRFHRGAEVTIRTRDGRALTKTVDFYVGSHHRPLGDEQVLAKFRSLGIRAFGMPVLNRIEDLVWTLEGLGDLAELNHLLCHGDPAWRLPRYP